MANMAFEQETLSADVNILKRPPFEGIPVTLKALTASELQASTFDVGHTLKNGKVITLAGAPINADGEVDNTGDAIGILLHDVHEDRPQGTVLKKAYINTDVAEEHANVTYASAVKSALPMCVFE